MPLVEGKCRSCGGIIVFENNAKQGICPFCHTPYVVEDIINHNNYITHNNYNIEHANIKMVDERSVEKSIENAEVYLIKFENYDQAEKIFASVAENAPNDYRGWWGLVRSKTLLFSDNKIGTEELEKIECYVNNTFKVAPTDKLSELQRVWQEYASRVKSIHNDLYNQKMKLEKERKSINEQITKIHIQMEKVDKNMKTFENLKALSEGIWLFIIVGLVLIFFGQIPFGILLILITIVLIISGFIGSAIMKRKKHLLRKMSQKYYPNITEINKNIENIDRKIRYGS